MLDKAGIGGACRQIPQGRDRRTGGCSPSRDMIRAFRALVARHKGEATADVTVAETAQRRSISPRSRTR